MERRSFRFKIDSEILSVFDYTVLNLTVNIYLFIYKQDKKIPLVQKIRFQIIYHSKDDISNISLW